MLVVVLAFWGLLLAQTDIRRGRMANIFAAILVYFIYSNLLGLGVTLIRKGQVPAPLGLWWVHLLMAGLAGFFLWRRWQGRPLLAWPGRSRRA
jgi:lipopolysaccharide export system permease protein